MCAYVCVCVCVCLCVCIYIYIYIYIFIYECFAIEEEDAQCMPQQSIFTCGCCCSPLSIYPSIYLDPGRTLEFKSKVILLYTYFSYIYLCILPYERHICLCMLYTILSHSILHHTLHLHTSEHTSLSLGT